MSSSSTLESLRSENELFGWALFEEFKRLGVETVFIAPGSRSTPLVLGAHAQESLKKVIHHDERGLAFAALGAAKASQKPVILITTSGTAVSNLLPAVTEAYYSHVPLLILSSDRPFDLRETGANQAINQTHIFANAVVDQFDVPAPSGQTEYKSIFSLLSYAVTKSIEGPVHINIMFQEPLAPPKSGVLNRDLSYLDSWFNSQKSHVTPLYVQNPEITLQAPLYNANEKVLIVAGGHLSFDDQKSLLRLSESQNIAILPDVISGLRFSKSSHNIIHHAEMLVDLKTPHPDVLLHFGGALQSKKLNEFCNRLTCKKVWVHSAVKRLDYQHQQKTIIYSTPSSIAQALLKIDTKSDPNFSSAFRELNILAESFIKKHLFETLNEAGVASLVTECIPENSTLYSSSSRPVRDFERFGLASKKDFKFFSNRGTSGIDGNLATFFGLANATESSATGVFGDLAFLHDTSSLPLLKKIKTPSVAIVINNNGGGIFSFLPIAEHKESFETYFGTPHGLDIIEIITGYGLNGSVVESFDELREKLKTAYASPGLTFLEIKTHRDHNLQFHRHLLKLWTESTNEVIP